MASVISEFLVKVSGDSSGAMSMLGSLDAKIGTSMKNYVTALGNMESSVGKFVSAHPAAVAAGGALAGALVFVGVKAVEAANKYDEQGVVLKNTAQITTGAAKQISDAFLSTAGSSTFSANTIISAYTPVSGMLGEVEGHALSAAEAMKVMSASTQLADATGMDLTNATQDLAAVMKDYHLSATQAGGASNTLYNLQRLTGNSTDSLTTAFNRLQPQVAASGMTMNQASGLMLDMTDKFGSGRKAIGLIGTSLASIISPGTKAQGALQEIGVALTDANGKFIGIGPALDALKSKLGSTTNAASDSVLKTKENAAAQKLFGDASGASIDKLYHLADSYMNAGSASEKSALLTETFGKKASSAGSTVQKFSDFLNSNTSYTEKAAIMQTIFGKNAADMQMIIDGGSKALDTATSKLTDNNNVSVAAADHANTLAGRQEILKASVADIAIMLGKALIPAIQSLMSAVERIVAPIAQWITKHEALTAILVKVVAGIVAVIAVASILSIIIAAMSWPVIAIMAFIAVTILIIKYWNDIKTFFMQWWPVILGVITGGIGLVVGVIIKYHQQIWEFIQKIWQDITNFILGIWNTIFADVSGVIDTITAFITSSWNTIYAIIQGVLNNISAFFVSIWNAISSTVMSAVNTIESVISSAWHVVESISMSTWNAISGVIHAIWNSLESSASAVFNAIASVISGVWNAVQSTASGMWNAIISTITGTWSRLSGLVSSAFNAIATTIAGVWTSIQSTASSAWNGIVSAVSAAWNTLSSVISAPLHAVVTVVNAFVGGADALTSAVGLGSPIPKINFATGGVVPGGWGGGDTVPAMLTPGERVLSLAQVSALGGHSAIDNMVQHFAAGGVVNPTPVPNSNPNPAYPGQMLPAPAGTPGATNAVSSVGSAVAGLAKGFIKGALIAAANTALAGPKAAIEALPSSPLFANVGRSSALKILDGVYNFITLQDNKNGTTPSAAGGVPGQPYTGGGSVGSWIAAALAALGLPASDGGAIGIIIQNESGGNPNAINLTDSNAAAGHPSQGLMQTIPSTFNAYALPGHGSITNPVDNIIAGVRYAQSRYGGVNNVPGVVSVAHGGAYVGYSVGGYANGGRIRVGENGPETLDLGDRGAYVSRNPVESSGGKTDFDYDKLAAAVQKSGINVGSITVGDSGTAQDVMDDLNWRLRTTRLV